MRRVQRVALAVLLSTGTARASAVNAPASEGSQQASRPKAAPVAAARALLWHGELAAAERAFESILDGDPNNVDALIGLAQARRWSGRPLAATAPVARAVLLAPDRRDSREELAWAYVDAGRPVRASALLQAAAVEPSAELAKALERLRKPVLSLSATAYDDSNGVARLAPRFALAFPLPGDCRLVVGAGASSVQDGGETIDRRVAGASLSIPWERASLSGEWAVYQGAGAPLYEGELSASYRILDELRLALAARRRPFLEPAEPLAADEQAFYDAGVNGALDPAAVARRGVDELRLKVQSAPLRASYAYADAKAFRVSDGNHGFSAALGVGFDLVSLIAKGSPVSFFARWDTYVAGFAEPRPAYFSPSSLVAQSPGAEMRVRIGSALEVMGEGGMTFTQGQSGWYGGVGSRLRLAAFSLALRTQAREDPWYHTRKAWVEIEIPL
jgi:tetratricopeptide (TPR) repeat protein